MKRLSLIPAAVLAVAWLSAGTAAQASERMAADYGCFNCHGAHPRGEAPTLAQLADKMAKYKGDDAGLAQKVAKYRTGEALEHVDAHERLSVDAATTLLHWLANGAQ